MAAVWRSRCAFARIISRKTENLWNVFPDLTTKLPTGSFLAQTICRKYSSHSHVGTRNEIYNFEVDKNPAEWNYVEQLLPFQIIPDIKLKNNYPSGFIPAKDKAANLPYYLERTKNSMVPIYLHKSYRGMRKITMIRHIDGDIWMMNDEIKDFLKIKNKRYVETRVHELGRHIEVKGDYVNDLLEWAYSKGF